MWSSHRESSLALFYLSRLLCTAVSYLLWSVHGWMCVKLVSLLSVAVYGRAGNSGGFHQQSLPSGQPLGAASAVRVETTVRSGRSLWYPWRLMVGCGHAQVPNPFASLHLSQLLLLMTFPGMKVIHCPLLIRNLGQFLIIPHLQGPRPPQQLLSALHHLTTSFPITTTRDSLLQPIDLFTTPTRDWLIITTIIHSGTVADVHMRYMVLF